MYRPPAPCLPAGWQAVITPSWCNLVFSCTERGASWGCGYILPSTPREFFSFHAYACCVFVSMTFFQEVSCNFIYFLGSDHSMDETIGMPKMTHIWPVPSLLHSPLLCIECALSAWSCHFNQIKLTPLFIQSLRSYLTKWCSHIWIQEITGILWRIYQFHHKHPTWNVWQTRLETLSEG